ncbi:hypothetical protein FKM82_018097 [Ascaphus truei]
MEDLHRAEGPGLRSEEEHAYELCVDEEQATEETFVSLLWNGVKAVAEPCLSCFCSRDDTPENNEHDSVIRWEE